MDMKPETETLSPFSVVEGWRSLAPAVHRGSTVLFRDVHAFLARDTELFDGYSYGQNGSPTTYELAGRIARLEGGGRTVLAPTGLAAAVLVNAATLRAGDHVLLPDCLYGPTREATLRLFGSWGICTSSYPASIGAGIAELLRPQTRLVWTESPGSNTFTVQDVPAIAGVTRARGVLCAMDNTWATPLGFRPLDHNVDLSVQALTKYAGGHSDLLMGAVTVRERALYERLRRTGELLGHYVSPDECALVLRGLGTMALRLKHHGASALAVANWLAAQPAVERVYYPALPTDPGHDLWRRDFRSAAGVLSFLLRADYERDVARMVEALRIFQLGASWGGLHSLVAILKAPQVDSATTRSLVRLHVGLEAEEDLLADLASAFRAMADCT
jgi:cysteine-S-conjugate beta-lyase